MRQVLHMGMLTVMMTGRRTELLMNELLVVHWCH